MATRFYLDNTAAPAITPGFAAWSRTADADRALMHSTKDGSAMASRSFTTITAANATGLIRQFISKPLAAGIAFATTDTIKCVIRCRESATNDNINRTPLCLKVYSEDGTTLRATLKALGAYGPNTTEWLNTGLRNKQLADGDTLDANYTTVAGDRLVLEVGGQLSSAGGSSVTGSMSFGSDSGTDLAENETGTAANNPWFEISRTVTFYTPAALDDDENSWWAGGMRCMAGLALAGALAGAAHTTKLARGFQDDQQILPPPQAVVAASHGAARASVLVKHPTRLYIGYQSLNVPPSVPADAGWDVAPGNRYSLVKEKERPRELATSSTSFSSTGVADDTIQVARLISHPMPAGVAFRTTDFFSAQMLGSEQDTARDINRQPLVLKVVSSDGGTVRATLLSLAHYGPAPQEWWEVAYRNLTYADRVALQTDYVTVDGDRLVVELGAQVDSDGGTSGLGSIPTSAAWSGIADLGVDQTDTGVTKNGWVEVYAGDLLRFQYPVPASRSSGQARAVASVEGVVTPAFEDDTPVRYTARPAWVRSTFLQASSGSAAPLTVEDDSHTPARPWATSRRVAPFTADDDLPIQPATVSASTRGEARATTTVAGTGAVSSATRAAARASVLVTGAGAVRAVALGAGRAVTALVAAGAVASSSSHGEARAVSRVAGTGAVVSATHGEARAVVRVGGVGAVASPARGEARARATVGAGGGIVAASSEAQARAVAQVVATGAVASQARGEGRARATVGAQGAVQASARGESRAPAVVGASGAVGASSRGEGRARAVVDSTAGLQATARGEARAVAQLAAPGTVAAVSRGEARTTAQVLGIAPVTASAEGQARAVGFLYGAIPATGRGEGRAVVAVIGVGGTQIAARGEARAAAVLTAPGSLSASARGEARARGLFDVPLAARARGEARAAAVVHGVGAVLASGRGEARAAALPDREGPVEATSRGEARARAFFNQPGPVVAAARGEARTRARVTTGHEASSRGQARGVAYVHTSSPPLVAASSGSQARGVAAVHAAGAVAASGRGEGRAVGRFIPTPTIFGRGEARAVVRLQAALLVTGNELSLPFDEMLMIERIELHRIKDIDPVTGLEVVVDRWEQHYAVESMDQAAGTNPAFLLRAREVRLLNYQTQWDGWFDAITLQGVRSPIDDEDFWSGVLTPNELLGPLFCTCLKLECARILAVQEGQLEKAALFHAERLGVERDLFRQGMAHNRTLSIRDDGFPHREEG